MVGVNPKLFIIDTVYHWVTHSTPIEIEMFRKYQVMMQRNPLPAPLRTPVLSYFKQNTTVLNWLMWDRSCETSAEGMWYKSMQAMLIRQHEHKLKGTNTIEEGYVDSKEEDLRYQRIDSILLWGWTRFLENRQKEVKLRNLHDVTGQSYKNWHESLIDGDAPDMLENTLIQDCYKQAAYGDVCNALMGCTDEEHENAVTLLRCMVLTRDRRYEEKAEVLASYEQNQVQSATEEGHRAQLQPGVVGVELNQLVDYEPVSEVAQPRQSILTALAKVGEAGGYEDTARVGVDLREAVNNTLNLEMLFDRYDLDKSGTINTKAELEMLSINVNYHMEKQHAVMVDGEVLNNAVEASNVGIDDSSAMTQAQFAEWYVELLMYVELLRGELVTG